MARHRPLFNSRSRVYIFAGALRLRDIPTIESLEKATASCVRQTVRKAKEVIEGLFMKNGWRISVTAVGKRRNKLRNWPRKPRNVFFSAKKAVKVEQAK